MKDRVEKIKLDEVKKSRKERVVRPLDVITGDRYSKKYANPPVPEGFLHYYGEWFNGFTIGQKITGNLFTWVPVGVLNNNGTLDGKNFNESFGRRNFLIDWFAKGSFSE